MKYVSNTIEQLEHDDVNALFKLKISNYHRSAIGAFSGTKLYIVPVNGNMEVIVSPIKPSTWGDLWELEISLKDQPGSVKKILKTLAKHKANVLLQESLSDSPDGKNRNHRLFFILDLSEYKNEHDQSTKERDNLKTPSLRPNFLFNEIIHDSYDSIVTVTDGSKKDINLKRMRFFFDHKELKSSTRPTFMSGNKLIISQDIIISEIYKEVSHEKYHCHVISDTEQKYLKIVFLNKNDKRLLISLKHNEKYGVLEELTGIYHDRGINIISSYSRLSEMEKTAHWYSFVETPEHFNKNTYIELLKTFSRSEQVKDILVQGHNGMNFNPMSKTMINTIDKLVEPEKIISNKKQNSIDSKGKNDYKSFIGHTPIFYNESWKITANQVFIAMPFNETRDTVYTNYVSSILEREGYIPYRIDQEPARKLNENIIQRIYREIARSEFIVADVTGSNPNVMYELGVAHSFGVNAILICQGALNSSHDKSTKNGDSLPFDTSQFPHIFYSPFDMETFEKTFRRQVQALEKRI